MIYRSCTWPPARPTARRGTTGAGAAHDAVPLSDLLHFPQPPADQPGGNQGHFVPPGKGFRWQGLRFRTESEVAVARELDAAKLLFFPQCACRITGANGKRETREPDFLIIHRGVVAILELEGLPH
jgi:hypothetical protein